MPEVNQAVENVARDANSAPKPNFELLSNENFTSENINNTQPVEETKPETTPEEVKTEPKVEETKPETVGEVETELALEQEEKTPESEAKESTETTEEDSPLTLDEDSSLENNEESSWKFIAKQEGYEIEEDSYEAYKEALLAPLKAEIESTKKMSQDAVLADVAPEIRQYFELSKAGMSVQDILAPLAQIESYKAMSNAEIVRADMIAKIEAIRPMSDSDIAWVDAEMEKKASNNEIDHEANGVRLQLDAAAKNIMDVRNQQLEQYKIDSENALRQKRQMESESMVKALNDMSDFMGSPLSPEVKKGLTERYNNGKYDQMFNDPAMKMKFIAYIELGEKAQKNLEAKSYNKGKMEIAKKLHNTPPLDNGGASKPITQHMTGNFERLNNDPNLSS